MKHASTLRGVPEPTQVHLAARWGFPTTGDTLPRVRTTCAPVGIPHLPPFRSPRTAGRDRTLLRVAPQTPMHPDLAPPSDELAAAPADAEPWPDHDAMPPRDPLPPDMNSQRTDPLADGGGKRVLGQQNTYRQQYTSRYTAAEPDEPLPHLYRRVANPLPRRLPQ